MSIRSISFIYIFTFILFSPFILHASVIDDLRQKISEKNESLEKLEEEIQRYEKEIIETQGQVKTLNSTIKEIDLTRKKLQTDIKVTEGKIDSTNLNINKLELDINDIDDEIKDNRFAIAGSLRDLREAESNSLIELVFLNENFSNFWSYVNNIEHIQGEIKSKLDLLKDKSRVLAATKEKEKEYKNDLIVYKVDLSDQKKLEDNNRKEKDGLLKQTKNKESNYQKILEEKKEIKDAFEKELIEYESKLKFALDPSTLPDDGVLGPPLDYIYITQKFGKTVDSERLYASGSHNGADFRASVGTPIKAMHSGVILGEGDTDITCRGASFGRWVLIDHENGLSATYAHLSVIKVKKDDIVKRGQVIGLSGNTGYSTGPHLHISVYATKGLSGEEGVSVKTRESKVCSGKIYTLPLAPINAYLDPLKFINI